MSSAIANEPGEVINATPQVPKEPVNWRKTHALGLPEGSIRAVLAVAIFATIWVLLVRNPRQEVPDYLRDLLFIIMGHYFASRKRASGETIPGPGPLFLPRGTVRVILFAGFAAVAAAMYNQGRMREPLKYPAVVTLMLVGGFLLGVLLAKIGDWWTARGHRVPRWVEDGKAIVAMIAAAGLIILVWNRYDPILLPRRPELFDKMNLRLGSYGPEHVLGAIVGFYYGSRS
ncbi:MAG: hypothetical protein JWN86_4524 [Planctomycetota bacterium]|nr:hypothetical protein [Planctomycetota bacterium]